MFGKVKTENLDTYLERIDRFFTDFESEKPISQDNINRYYAESYWGYRVFHSWSGAIHMALSEDGRFSKNDYFGQARRVEDLIIELGILEGKVLEVGCGGGFNLRYLAARFPKLDFVGIDISNTNVESASRLCSRYPNCDIYAEDFHNLERFKEGDFSLVFGVETLCHALDMSRALSQISRVLSKNGELAIFDGFRSDFEKFDSQWQKAVIYTERAMAVPRFLTIDELSQIAYKAGLRQYSTEDLSEQIMPNLVRLSDRSKAFFRLKPVAILMKRLLPPGLVNNAIAGLLMSVTVTKGAHKYFFARYKKV